MLSVVDNLELAMNSTNDHKAIDKDLLQGLEMTHKEILKVFEKFSVKPIEAKEKEAVETYDRLLRASAEFDNYKKRSSREMEEFRKFANQSLIKEMLSVVDNLELAMNSTNGHKAIDKDLLQGLEMTHKEILKVFEKFNVKPIDAKGQPFDPTFHEAVMQEETNDSPKNTVVNELQRGYMIHDRLLRPSMVVVAKPKENNDGEKQHNKEI
jgi:molecular chaperone GrpE